MGLHFLGKMKIMVIRDVERTEVDFICKVCFIHGLKLFMNTFFNLKTIIIYHFLFLICRL